MPRLLTVGALVGALANVPAAEAVQAGETAPAFESAALGDGAPIRLAELRGKVVLVDFWASWCAPCRLSLPWMEQTRKELGGAGLEIVAVNVDENVADARAFLARFPVSYRVASDAHGDVAALYDVQDMPSSYLIDRRGVVREVHAGFNPQTGRKLHESIVKLLKEQP